MAFIPVEPTDVSKRRMSCHIENGGYCLLLEERKGGREERVREGGKEEG